MSKKFTEILQLTESYSFSMLCIPFLHLMRYRSMHHSLIFNLCGWVCVCACVFSRSMLVGFWTRMFSTNGWMRKTTVWTKGMCQSSSGSVFTSKTTRFVWSSKKWHWSVGLGRSSPVINACLRFNSLINCKKQVWSCCVILLFSEL